MSSQRQKRKILKLIKENLNANKIRGQMKLVKLIYGMWSSTNTEPQI